MTINELINILKNAKKTHGGDVPVLIERKDCDLEEIHKLKYDFIGEDIDCERVLIIEPDDGGVEINIDYED